MNAPQKTGPPKAVISIHCPCGNVFEVASELSGRNVRCLQCARLHVVKRPLLRAERAAPLHSAGGNPAPSSEINWMALVYVFAGVGVAIFLVGFYVLFIHPSKGALDHAAQEAKRTDSDVRPSDFQVLQLSKKTKTAEEKKQDEVFAATVNAPVKKAFEQDVPSDPKELLKTVRVEEIVQKDAYKAHGYDSEIKTLYQIRMFGTDAQIRQAIEKVYPKVANEEQIGELLTLRKRLYEGQLVFARYVPEYSRQYGVPFALQRGTNLQNVFDFCKIYIVEFDEIIGRIDALILAAVPGIKPSDSILGAARGHPDTGLEGKLKTALKGR